MSRAFCLTTVTLATALTLTACGGSATVESDDMTSVAAPSTSMSSSTVTTQSAPPPAPAGPQDQPAREVDSVPEQAERFTREEEDYLAHLRENGLNVEGVEDQLTVTGHSVCADETITRDVVSGQLVEQRRTDMSPEAVGQLLTDTARDKLC